MKQKDGTFVDHTDDKIIMVDEQTHIQLLKLDKETGQALGGAKFVVTDSKGNKVMKFVTKDDAYDIIGKLVVGETYTFTEVFDPSGCADSGSTGYPTDRWKHANTSDCGR